MKVMVDPKSPDHWKFRHLADLLYGKSKVAKSCAIAAAFGHVNALWCRAMDLADDGRLKNWDDAMVAQRSHFAGDPKKYVDGLIKIGFLEVDHDGTYVVHDWHEHQGDIIAERAYEREKKRRQRAEAAEKRRREAEEAALKADPDRRVDAGSTPGIGRAYAGSTPGVDRGEPGDPPQASVEPQGLTNGVPRDNGDSPAAPFPSPSPSPFKEGGKPPPGDISASDSDRTGGSGPQKLGDLLGRSTAQIEAPPREAPAESGAEQEARELRVTVGAFSAFRIPGEASKLDALADLRRQGVTHQWLRAAAKANPKADFYAVVRALRKNSALQPARPEAPSGPKCETCKGKGGAYERDPKPGENVPWVVCGPCKGSGIKPS